MHVSYLIETEVGVAPTRTAGQAPASPAVRNKTFPIQMRDGIVWP
jgi:hypothetical protein